ncbi:MAG: AAA family ATPase [Woeseiaceae bacterium]|nr:AAA family ATPase [Woeseiaceae bacterium]
MSKIQKAINEIQSSRNKARTPGAVSQLGVLVDKRDVPGDDEAPEALLGDETRQIAALETPVSTKLVEVSRKSLTDAGFIAPDDEEQLIINQFRQIKRPLIAHAFGKRATKIEGGHVILVTSALPGDGKTFSCINLALSIASEQDRSVLLIDGDVAKAHVSRLFGIEEQPGLTDILQRDSDYDLSDVIVETDVDGLSLIPAGKMNSHVTELFASNRMERLIKAVSAQDPNRVVIFDSSPLLPTSESRVLSTLVGQVVLIVCANKTPRSAVLNAIEMMEEGKAVNVVLNQARNEAGFDYYGGRYGYAAGERAAEESRQE